jgi:hypothetical protein
MDATQKQQIIDGLKAQHSDMELFSVESETGGVFVVHRCATGPERRIYRQLQADEKRLDAQDSLMNCVLYPPAPELLKLREAKPFVVEMIVDGILAASGVYVDAVRKKL